MLMLKPSIAMLDEIDSGLDVDAIKLVSDAILKLKNDKKLRLKLGLNAKKRATELFSYDRFSKNINNFFDNL